MTREQVNKVKAELKQLIEGIESNIFPSSKIRGLLNLPENIDEIIKRLRDFSDTFQFLGKSVTVKIDRFLGSKHPDHNFIYPVNYGYVPDTRSLDGEEVDAYVLGISEPLQEFNGMCIAFIHRINDNDVKLIVAPEGQDFTDEQIRALKAFQEQYFKFTIIRNKDSPRRGFE